MEESQGISKEKMLSIISEAQKMYIGKNSTNEVFDSLLKGLLDLTGSEYGFIGETLIDEESKKYLKTYAITDISWNDETRKFYQDNAPSGLEFRNLENLFGYTIKNDCLVISNDPSTDSRAGGRPPGHPDLNTYLGVPLMYSGSQIGMFGIANRANGYSENIVDSIQPYISTVTQLIFSYRADKERKEVISQLEKQKRRLELVIEGTRLGFWDWNPQTNEVSFNARWAEMLGYNFNEIENKLSEWSDRVHPDDIKSCFDDIEDHISGKTKYYENVHRMKHKDGGWVYILDRGTIVEWDSDGRPIRFTGTHTDITREKAAEKKAQIALQAKSTFLAHMSHEIRTPLNGIVGAASLLKETVLNTEQKKYINIMHMQGELLLRILNDILDISKIENDQMSINSNQFNLTVMINDIKNIFEEQIRTKGLVFEVEFHDSCPEEIVSDDLRLKQVLINLLSNSVKFTEKGKISLKVYNENKYLFFDVYDTGLGIKSENLNKIFDSFTQEDSGIERKYGGTGLGLNICKKIISLMGGDMYVESIEKEWSRFVFKVPLSVENRKSKKDETLSDFEKFKKNIKGMKLLMAEDNEVNQLIQGRLLKNMGLIVDIVKNGEEALKYLRNNKVDYVLMDIHMPVLNGIDATKLIMSDRKIKTKPIVIPLTADITDESIKACQSAGMVGYLLKPFKREQFLKQFHGIINNHRKKN